MTSAANRRHPALPANPVDVVERVATGRDWPFERFRDGEIVVRHSGHWCGYNMHVSLHPEGRLLFFALVADLRVQSGKREAVRTLVARINERLPLGHFDLGSEDGHPVFRHTELLRGEDTVGAAKIEEIFAIALDECERYHPAFQLMVWAGKTAEEALEAAILETVGEA